MTLLINNNLHQKKKKLTMSLNSQLKVSYIQLDF